MFYSLASCFTPTIVSVLKGWCYLCPDTRVYLLRCVTPWRRLGGGIGRVSSLTVLVADRQTPRVGSATCLRLARELALRDRSGVLWLQHRVHVQFCTSGQIQFIRRWWSECTAIQYVVT
jgi:hypothetical protein